MDKIPGKTPDVSNMSVQHLRPSGARISDLPKGKSQRTSDVNNSMAQLNPGLNTSTQEQSNAQARHKKSHYFKPTIEHRVKVNEEPGSSDSDLEVSSYHEINVPKHRHDKLIPTMSSIIGSSTTTSTSITYSNTTLGSSIHKFRDEFEDFKCKMRIFGESLNLCKCIASDFKGKLNVMERRLHGLEKRQKSSTAESNYTAIIQKNKQLETKTLELIGKLQKCGTEEEMREVAGRICKNYLPGLWKVLEPSELEFRRISGGLSNFIYILGLPEDLTPLYARLDKEPDDDGKSVRSVNEPTAFDEPKKVLLRIYGQVHGERAMDAIVTESVIFTLLSERKLGPKLFGVFSGGRIEEFIPSRSLLTSELADPALSMKIAEKTAAIHSMDIPLSKEPTFIWKTMAKWLKTVKEECFINGVKGKNEREDNCIKRLKEINYDNEIEWVKKFLATVDSPVVFCHNDLQEGNILLLDDQQPTTDEFESSGYVQTYGGAPSSLGLEDVPSKTSMQLQTSSDSVNRPYFEAEMKKSGFLSTSGIPISTDLAEDGNTTDSVMSHISDSGEPKIFLIDFEYCAYNHRGFDIANHFQEWAYDYSNPEPPFYYENQDHWPTLEQKEIFIKEYLKHYHANLGEEGMEANIDAVNKLLGEVEAFAVASHLFWTLWSIVNANKSQIPFGYWEYGLSRLETYLRLKQEAIKKDKFGLPQKRKIEEVDI